MVTDSIVPYVYDQTSCYFIKYFYTDYTIPLCFRSLDIFKTINNLFYKYIAKMMFSVTVLYNRLYFTPTPPFHLSPPWGGLRTSVISIAAARVAPLPLMEIRHWRLAFLNRILSAHPTVTGLPGSMQSRKYRKPRSLQIKNKYMLTTLVNLYWYFSYVSILKQTHMRKSRGTIITINLVAKQRVGLLLMLKVKLEVPLRSRVLKPINISN